MAGAFDTGLGWYEVGLTVAAALVTYAGLVVLLRLTGNRTLARMRAFDFVVTIATGTIVASAILDDRVPILKALVAMATLMGAQILVAHVGARSGTALRLFTSEPRLLFYAGRFERRAMRRSGVAEDEVRTIMRSQGYAKERDVWAVVLEPTGDCSVLPRSMAPKRLAGSTARGVGSGRRDK